jgi:predicted secreted acid phosphatase
LALQNNVTIFFVTGRPESQRNITTTMLQKTGYKGWKKLYLEPENYRSKHKTAVTYKSSIRKAIENQGYRILFSMGDQISDYEGGYTERGFKLPNPYYIIK